MSTPLNPPVLYPVGTIVCKASGKPFSSGNKTATVSGVIDHPNLEGIKAYTFTDAEYVRCSYCTNTLRVTSLGTDWKFAQYRLGGTFYVAMFTEQSPGGARSYRVEPHPFREGMWTFSVKYGTFPWEDFSGGRDFQTPELAAEALVTAASCPD